MLDPRYFNEEDKKRATSFIVQQFKDLILSTRAKINDIDVDKLARECALLAIQVSHAACATNLETLTEAGEELIEEYKTMAKFIIDDKIGEGESAGAEVSQPGDLAGDAGGDTDTEAEPNSGRG